MTTPVLALRLIVDGSAETAHEAFRAITDALTSVPVEVSDVAVKAYWKIAGTSEITCTFHAEARAEEVFDQIATRLASRWGYRVEDEFEYSTIWNPEDGTFVSPQARWAHLQLIR